MRLSACFAGRIAPPLDPHEEVCIAGTRSSFARFRGVCPAKRFPARQLPEGEGTAIQRAAGKCTAAERDRRTARQRGATERAKRGAAERDRRTARQRGATWRDKRAARQCAATQREKCAARQCAATQWAECAASKHAVAKSSAGKRGKRQCDRGDRCAG